MDTQAMSLIDELSDKEKKYFIVSHKPMEVKHIPMIEHNLRQELKELINEVLDERNE
tara:strand:+ start:436 stop:606 length:171 start_codon:yes stop_codon:yes gene_type:complete